MRLLASSAAVGGAIALVVVVLLGLTAVVVVRRGTEWMFNLLLDASPAFAFEFTSGLAPSDVIREVVLPLVPELDPFDFRIESQTGDTLLLARRFTPRAAHSVPLGLAVVAFVLGVVSSSHNAPQHGGIAAAILVGVAIVLSLVVRRTERLTFSARASDHGSRVSVAGAASPEFRDFLASRLAADPGDWAEPQAVAVLRDSVRREREQRQ